ncbi:MAG: DNRLRE domain-containing protein, partial [Pyrinomonadaceae bacterium]|nr:DNRLRE domain-containing protein [Phycisphaerales bacterium]
MRCVASFVRAVGFVVCGVGAEAAMVGTATADTVTLVAAADNTMYQGSNTRSNGVGSHFFVGRTDENRLRRGLLRFDLSSIPAGSTITNVSLRLWMSRTRGPATNVTLHQVLAAWGEGASNASDEEGEGAAAQSGDATWSHRLYNSTPWLTQGGEFTATASATASVGGEAFYTWSSPGMTANVEAWLNAPASNFGWLLRGNESSDQTAKRFDTRENTTAANRPTLVVTFDPP